MGQDTLPTRQYICKWILYYRYGYNIAKEMAAHIMRNDGFFLRQSRDPRYKARSGIDSSYMGFNCLLQSSLGAG